MFSSVSVRRHGNEYRRNAGHLAPRLDVVIPRSVGLQVDVERRPALDDVVLGWALGLTSMSSWTRTCM
jgi:hypothetical protein